jgi:phosphoglycerate dehydrogenase-like enzyme
MQGPDVLVLTPDAEAYLPLLQGVVRCGAAVTLAETAQQALARYQGQEVLLARPDLAAEVLDRMREVRWVQSSWAGVTPLLSLERREFILTGIKDTFGPQMAEYVLAYLLAREVRVFERLDRQAGRNWWPAPSGTLQGKAMGVMGTGSIGRHIARMARPFGLKVRGYSRSGTAVAPFERVFAAGELNEFLAGLDYLVCVLPDTSETRHLLDVGAFDAMPGGCYLVNVGRGNLIDEAALARALRDGKLSGAVLDVFEREPLEPESPLWDAPNLLVTGHVAAQSAPQDIARIFSENYRSYVADEPLRYRIDLEKGY